MSYLDTSQICKHAVSNTRGYDLAYILGPATTRLGHHCRQVPETLILRQRRSWSIDLLKIVYSHPIQVLCQHLIALDLKLQLEIQLLRLSFQLIIVMQTLPYLRVFLLEELSHFLKLGFELVSCQVTSSAIFRGLRVHALIMVDD